MVEGAGRVPLMVVSVPGSTNAWVCPRRRVAVWIYWPQLARAHSVAETEGEKDAICHITCSQPASSGCSAGISHKLFQRGQLSISPGAPVPSKSWCRWLLLVLACVWRGGCHLHLLLDALFLALRMQTCSSIFLHSIEGEGGFLWL